MLDRENTSPEDHFKQALKDLKDYVLNLLKRRTEKVEEKVKSQVDDALKNQKPKSSWMDKFKNLFGGDEEMGQKPNKHEVSQEDEDEYIPQDMEFGESLGEPSRFAEIYPGFLGYFTSGKKSYFNRSTNLWSKRKRLSTLNIYPDTNQQSHIYAGMVISGTVAIPLPEGSVPDTSSLNFSGKSMPIFQIDQNNCIYMISREKQYVSFKFYTHQILPIYPPIPEDNEKIVFSKLSRETRDFLDSLNGNSAIVKASKIQIYIMKTKKYSTRLQGTLRNKSNNKNYISNLDKSEVLECFSANALFVALCREVGMPARLVVGHMVQALDTTGKSLLTSDNGHAWSNIWDEKDGLWKRFDATPTVKENGEESNQNMDSGGSGQESGDGQGGESNMDQESQDGGQGQGGDGGEDKEGKGKQDGKDDGGDSSQGEGQQGGTEKSGQEGGNSTDSGKTPSEMLDELIAKAKDDNLIKEAEKLKKTIEKLENVTSKEAIRKVLDESGLSDFAKDIVNKIGNEEILKQEQEKLQNLEDEKEVDKALKDSLLDEEFRNKLKDYALQIKKRIQEEKKKVRAEMQRMGFNEEEVRLYKIYKELEKEVEGEVIKQIRALEKILPPNLRTIKNEQEYFASGSSLGESGKLIEYELTGDPRVFRRNQEIKESNEINMFETIVIDRSGSMGKFEDKNSPLREAVKAAIIRAKVLEHFKVHFSIVIFDTDMEEVMEFGDKFSNRGKNNVPSKLMRAVMKSGGTDIGKPLVYVLDSMKRYARKNGLRSFGNISFLGDGEPTDGLKGDALKALIEEIKKTGFGLIAYYINGSSQKMDGLEKYFGSQESGGTVMVPNVSELTGKLIGAYNENLRKIIKKYTNN